MNGFTICKITSIVAKSLKFDVVRNLYQKVLKIIADLMLCS
jgi:hypothetical protein